ncbi:MAG: hypothetical protein ACPGU1_16625 [Myxococcota bacterium]
MKTMNNAMTRHPFEMALVLAMLCTAGCAEGTEPVADPGEASTQQVEGGEAPQPSTDPTVDPSPDLPGDPPVFPSPDPMTEEVTPEMLDESQVLTAEVLKARGPQMNCVPTAEEGTVHVLDTIEATGQRVVQTLGSEPCSSTLGFQELDGSITEISATPGAYYNASAIRLGDTAVVAWTKVDHGEWEVDDAGRMLSREVNPVIEVAVMDGGGTWHGPERLIDLDEAAWLGRLVMVDDTLTLLFWRDSLFEHLFFTQEGRPETDGLYTLALGVDSGEVSTGTLTRIQDYVMNFDPPGGEE